MWAYDAVNNVFYAAHLNPYYNNVNDWAQTGSDLATALQVSLVNMAGLYLSVTANAANVEADTAHGLPMRWWETTLSDSLVCKHGQLLWALAGVLLEACGGVLLLSTIARWFSNLSKGCAQRAMPLSPSVQRGCMPCELTVMFLMQCAERPPMLRGSHRFGAAFMAQS